MTSHRVTTLSRAQNQKTFRKWFLYCRVRQFHMCTVVSVTNISFNFLVWPRKSYFNVSIRSLGYPIIFQKYEIIFANICMNRERNYLIIWKYLNNENFVLIYVVRTVNGKENVDAPSGFRISIRFEYLISLWAFVQDRIYIYQKH